MDISCHHEDNYYSSQPLQINVIKSPIEFRSRINWAKLSSKAIALETSEMNTVSLNHKLSENTARSRETAKKRLQPFDSNDLPIKSNTLLATSSKPSSLMWQQAVSLSFCLYTYSAGVTLQIFNLRNLDSLYTVMRNNSELVILYCRELPLQILLQTWFIGA